MSPRTKAVQIRHDPIQMFVIDVLRHDIENIESIAKLMNNENCIGWRKHWPHDFTQEEVSSALRPLISGGLVKALRHDLAEKVLVDTTLTDKEKMDLSPFWFVLTKKGWAAWEKWDPPVEPIE